MANDVKIIITAVDKASATLKKVGNEGALSFKSLGISAAAVTAALVAVGVATKKVIDDTVAYNLSMRNLAQNLGITTEAASRLTQTADDFGVSQQAVTAALQMAVKKGFAPNIDTIAKLADEYNNIQDPVQRAARMVEVFGRNWTALTPMLREGGDAIRKAYGAIESGLVVTEQSAQAARDYQIAMDKLNDTAESLKVTIGNKLIPVVTDFMNKLNEGVNRNQFYKTSLDLIDRALAAGIITQDEYNEMVLTTAKGTRILRDDIGDLTDKVALFDRAARGGAHAIALVGKNAGTAAAPINDVGDEAGEAATNLDLAAKAADFFNREMGIANTVWDAAASAIAASNLPLADQARYLREIAVLSGKVTAEQQTAELATNNVTLAFEAGAISEQAYYAALKDIAAGMTWEHVQADLAKASLDKLGVATTNAQQPVGQLDLGMQNLSKTVQNTVSDVGDLVAKIAELRDKEITITTHYVYTGNQGGTEESRNKASGGPVQAGKSYIVGEIGPEVFVPQTSGTIVPNAALKGNSGVGGVTNIFNIQAADTHAVVQEVMARMASSSRRAGYSGLHYAG